MDDCGKKPGSDEYWKCSPHFARDLRIFIRHSGAGLLLELERMNFVTENELELILSFLFKETLDFNALGFDVHPLNEIDQLQAVEEWPTGYNDFLLSWLRNHEKYMIANANKDSVFGKRAIGL